MNRLSSLGHSPSEDSDATESNAEPSLWREEETISQMARMYEVTLPALQLPAKPETTRNVPLEWILVDCGLDGVRPRRVHYPLWPRVPKSATRH